MLKCKINKKKDLIMTIITNQTSINSYIQLKDLLKSINTDIQTHQPVKNICLHIPKLLSLQSETQLGIEKGTIKPLDGYKSAEDFSTDLSEQIEKVLQAIDNLSASQSSTGSKPVTPPSAHVPATSGVYVKG